MLAAGLGTKTHLSALQTASEECLTCRRTRHTAGAYPSPPLLLANTHRNQFNYWTLQGCEGTIRLWCSGPKLSLVVTQSLATSNDNRFTALVKIPFRRCAISITLALSSGNTVILFNGENPFKYKLAYEDEEKKTRYCCYKLRPQLAS